MDSLSGLDGALRHAFGKPDADEDVPSSRDGGALAPGSYVEQFRVIAQVGSGGMGELFLAHDEKLDRRVALKSIRASVRLSQMGRQRFHQEAQILGRLDHAGICRIYDYVETGAMDFLVLEFIEGEPLSTTLGASLDAGKATLYGIQIAEALAAAHREGVVHRDLKPSNLMLTPTGQIKVLDFGIARARADSEPEEGTRAEWGASSSAGEMTQAGAVMGTLDYMSPEQARGEKVTGATDVYALGMLLQEMWTGTKARPRGLKPLDMLQHIERDGRLPATGLKGDARQLVDEMCAPSPTMRPTAHAVQERLKWIAGRPKRRLRAGIAGGLALVAALGGLKYTLDLQTAHAATVENQQRADRLIRFMHDDLWSKLGSVGRLDILEDVWEKSSEYFESIDVEDLSDEQLADRSRALRQIGTVWRDKRDEQPGSAERAFTASYELAVELFGRDSDNLDRRFEVGQAEFYIGELGFLQRDYAVAEEWLGRYHTTSLALAAAEPENEDYAMELAWSEHNLGALYFAQSRPADALAIFSKSAEVWRGFLDRYPGDEGWLEELASTLSWLGNSALSSSDLAQARAGYEESIGAWKQLIAANKNQRQWSMEWVVASQRLAMVEWLAGEAAASESRLTETQSVLEELCAWDALNAEWGRSLALNYLSQGRALFSLQRTQEAKEKFAECLDRLGQLFDGEGLHRDRDYHRAICHIWIGECELRGGDTQAANESAQMAMQLIVAGPKESAADTTADAPWVARAELLMAASADPDDRLSCLGRARQALTPHLATSRDPRLLWPYIVVESLLGNTAEAEAWAGTLTDAGVDPSTWKRWLEMVGE